MPVLVLSTHSSLPFVGFFVLLAFVTNATSGEITLHPVAQSTEVGHNTTFDCIADSGVSVDWSFSDNIILHNGSTSEDGRFSNYNGVLTLTLLTTNDSGEYRCFETGNDSDEKNQGRAVLKVYEMPSYFAEAVALTCVNGILLISFIACIIQTSRQHHINYKFHSKC